MFRDNSEFASLFYSVVEVMNPKRSLDLVLWVFHISNSNFISAPLIPLYVPTTRNPEENDLECAAQSVQCLEDDGTEYKALMAAVN